MKKQLCSIVISFASSLMCASTFASDGTISITGNVIGSTCKVDAGNGGNGDARVALDRISSSSLAEAGNTAAFKAFSIKLSGCDSTLTGQVKVGFEVGPNTDTASGRLINTGSAEGVQLELRNADNSVIKVGDNSTVKGAALVLGTDADATGSASMNYLVGYHAAKAKVTAGTVISSVTYSIIYP